VDDWAQWFIGDHLARCHDPSTTTSLPSVLRTRHAFAKFAVVTSLLNRAVELGQEDYDRMSACATATAAAYCEDKIMQLQLALYEEVLSE
jgi:hypothetical protein